MVIKRALEEFFGTIPKNAKVALFGKNNIIEKLIEDLKNYRKDIKISFFIDIKENKELNIYSLNDAIKNHKFEFNFIISFINDVFINNIINTYNIPFTIVNDFINDYYLNKHKILNDKNYEKISDIFYCQDDKIIFNMMFKRRCKIINDDTIKKYYLENYYENAYSPRTIKSQYLDKIKKDKVKIILDLGFNSGFNSIAFDNYLPNLQKIHAFEAIYDLCKNDFIENFIPKDKIILINKAISNKIGKTKFLINNNNLNASMSTFSASVPYKKANNYKEIEVETTTIDEYYKENNIPFDFIKMDIEGSELYALEGGMETINKLRPQLAISIYHNDTDFINIPIFLYENLKDYDFKIGHYSPDINETILYAIPKEL